MALFFLNWQYTFSSTYMCNYRNEACSHSHLLTMVVSNFMYSVHPNFQWNALLKEPTTTYSDCSKAKDKVGVNWNFIILSRAETDCNKSWQNWPGLSFSSCSIHHCPSNLLLLLNRTFYQCFWLYPEFIQTKQINKLVIAWNNKDCK